MNEVYVLTETITSDEGTVTHVQGVFSNLRQARSTILKLARKNFIENLKGDNEFEGIETKDMIQSNSFSYITNEDEIYFKILEENSVDDSDIVYRYNIHHKPLIINFK